MVQPRQRLRLQANSVGDARITPETRVLDLDHARRCVLAVLGKEHFSHAASSEQLNRTIGLARERVVRQRYRIGSACRRKHGADRAPHDSRWCKLDELVGDMTSSSEFVESKTA